MHFAVAIMLLLALFEADNKQNNALIELLLLFSLKRKIFLMRPEYHGIKVYCRHTKCEFKKSNTKTNQNLN